MSRLPLRRLNDRDETHDTYTTSLIHRQEQASAYYRQQLRDYDRPSSSSDSQVSSERNLRRTAKFEAKPSRLRSSSLDSPTREPEPDQPRKNKSHTPSHRRTASAHCNPTSYPPHPALRVSSRTKAAITYALEVAIRQPNPFTPDDAEENAQMSSLGGGRATNGGASGPVPVPTTGTPTGMRTPRDIMRDRNAREARRQEEQRAEEQRRLAEERRRSAERRAAAVGGAAPRFSQGSSQYTPESQQAPFEGRGSGVQPVATSDALGQPPSRASQSYPDSRPRGPSVTQQDAPRPAPATAGAARKTQASQQAPRQPTSSGAAAGSSAQQSQADRAGAPSFPQAFQRWETLSSHWEGLTSYWLHKLERNTEEIQNTVPNAVTLNRQITDLSAAGANLFHAVVELQRLRASSERKFQRWFFESKANDEKSREIQGGLERQIQIERGGRDDAARQRADASIQAENALREVQEIRRELMISKDEARRAWEELGRRNQESMETAQSLKDGRVTLVHGVQVVPYFGGPSRSVSGGQRPSTRDGQPPYGSTGMASAAGAAGLQSPGDERDYYQQDASPTNTDPFMESGGVPAREPGKQSLAAGTYQPYNIGGTPTTTSTAIPLAGQRPAPASAGSLGASRSPPAGTPSNLPVTTQEAQRFYQHAPQETFLHSPQSSSQAVASAQQPPTAREDIRSDASYISEGDEYPQPNYPFDDSGRPLQFSARVQSAETDDSYDVGADVRREQELAAQYGTGGYESSGGQYGGASMLPPEAPSVPATSAQAMASYAPTTSSQEQPRRPSYEGGAYEGWESLQTRHHHPTRLSDVLEEEEERSSRRTGE